MNFIPINLDIFILLFNIIITAIYFTDYFLMAQEHLLASWSINCCFFKSVSFLIFEDIIVIGIPLSVLIEQISQNEKIVFYTFCDSESFIFKIYTIAFLIFVLESIFFLFISIQIHQFLDLHLFSDLNS